MSDQHCLKLLKNCYGTKDAAANWFNVLQKALEQRGFQQCTNIDPCLFTRDDCIIITYVDDCLIFYKNDKILEELINSLENELQRDVDELIVRNLKFSVRKGIAYLWITIEPSTALLTPRSMKGC